MVSHTNPPEGRAGTPSCLLPEERLLSTIPIQSFDLALFAFCLVVPPSVTTASKAKFRAILIDT